MKVTKGNAARNVLAAVLLSLVAFIILVQYAPDSVALSPNNYGWNGLEAVSSTYKVNFTTSLSAVPAKSVLVLTQPSLGYSASDAAHVKSFLEGGGTVLVASKSQSVNSLLSQLGSGIVIESNYTISDRTYNWKSSSVPTALVLPGAKTQFKFLSNVSGIALNEPSPIIVSGASAVKLAITSQFSTSSAPGSPKGPFTVMVAEKVGNGVLIVVGDPQFLLNSEWTVANNRVLIGNLFGNAQVFIDASHWGVSSVAQLKSEFGRFYALVSSPPLKYFMTLFLVGIAMALVPSKTKIA